MKFLYALLILVFFVFKTGISQNTQVEYNIPPGDIVKNKLEIIDYSYKLSDVKAAKVSPLNLKFLSVKPEVNLEELKMVDVKRYDYYIKAESYYQSLSSAVKQTFSLEELWHIYMFDAKLKETLLGIK